MAAAPLEEGDRAAEYTIVAGGDGGLEGCRLAGPEVLADVVSVVVV